MRAEHAAPASGTAVAASTEAASSPADATAPAGSSSAAAGEGLWEYALRRWRMRRKQ